MYVYSYSPCKVIASLRNISSILLYAVGVRLQLVLSVCTNRVFVQVHKNDKLVKVLGTIY